MPFPRRHGRDGRPQHHDGYYDGGGEAPLDCSDRTPTSYGPSEYTGAYTSAYTESGDAYLEASDRTPHTQYTGYTGYTGAYTEAYTQEGYDSGRTPYTERMYMEGGTVNTSGRSSNYHTYASGAYADSQYYGASAGVASHQDAQSVHSRLSEGSARYGSQTQPYTISQYQDGSSVCPSISATTVADGGRGRCPYQIEFKVQNQGKQLSATKRLIHFRFGYANSDAMSQGQTGTECRGEEHDLLIAWSITGGKRSIHMDGREIQYSAGKRANASRRADMLEAAFRMADHTYEIRCFAYKPAAGSPEKRDPNWRQYSLVIDGRSFFDLPQIFDLGLKGLVRHVNPPSQVHSNAQSQMSELSYSASGGPDVKNAVQARIDRQRMLMKQKQRAVAAEKRQIRDEHDESERSGVTSVTSDLQSMGLESAVHSAAPSELDEMRNRKNPVEASATTERVKVHTDQTLLTEYKPAVKPGSEIPRRPMPQQQHQIQPQQQNPRQPQYQNRHANPQYQNTSNQPRAQYQIQTLPQRPQNATAIQPRQLQIEAQQQPQNAHSAHTQEQTTRPLEYAPQQPPTYEQITRDLGTSGGNSVESSAAPRQGGGANVGNQDFDVGVKESNALVTTHDNAARDATKSSSGNARATPLSSVDQRGINKWGYF